MPSESPTVHVEIKLNTILDKQIFNILGVLSWLRLETSRAGYFEHGRETLGALNSGEFLDLDNNALIENGCFLLTKNIYIFLLNIPSGL